jgi:hypothetical protein
MLKGFQMETKQTRLKRIRTGFSTQHDAAKAWADYMLEVHANPDDCPRFRASSIEASGRELMHYSVVQEWRTKDGLLIGNLDCWSAGWAHCSAVSTSDWLSLEALKEEGIDHLSMELAGSDESNTTAYRALRKGESVIFRETGYIDDTEFNSNRTLKWLQIREGDKWVSIRAIRETGRDHLDMDVNEARLWLKQIGDRRKHYLQGLRNRCKEIIPTDKNFAWLHVGLFGSNGPDFRGIFDFKRRGNTTTWNGRPCLYYRAGLIVRIVETYTTVHNPRAFVWKLAAIDESGLPVGIALFGRDETGQIWFYEFPMRYRSHGLRRREQPFGVNAVYAHIVDMERALLGMSKADILVAET